MRKHEANLYILDKKVNFSFTEFRGKRAIIYKLNRLKLDWQIDKELKK